MKLRGLLLALIGIAATTAAVAEDRKVVDDMADVRGAIVFRTYCVLCHGPNGDGKGRAAKNYTPPPANLTTSTVPDEYKIKIIGKGGGAMGRSPYMPPWEGELTEDQIRDVVAYLRAINVKAAKQ